jgi:hypothetical protein
VRLRFRNWQVSCMCLSLPYILHPTRLAPSGTLTFTWRCKDHDHAIPVPDSRRAMWMWDMIIL